MEKNNLIECSGFYFIHSFDSGNLGHVERVPTDQITGSVTPKSNVPEIPDYEFNIWTRPDCAGTEFENGNRTWFYFGIQASEPNVLVRLNMINLNKQGKMYNQGMAPVTRTLPGKPQWERIRDKPIHTTDENTFTLSFRYKTSDNVKATTFFAFTYPFSFAELQIALNSIDLKMLPLPRPQSHDDIYYCRECLVYSLEGRRVDLLTISSYHGITQEKEERLKNLFPEKTDRPFKFNNKKVIFMSARVHPGETPSSFVFNGFLNLLLTRGDPIAIQLRKLYVFKMIPFLNPDGVARGHYRTDTRGVNLNRVYLNPSFTYHPTVYASRALIRYYHFGEEREDVLEDLSSITSRSMQNISECSEFQQVSDLKRSKRSSTSTYRSMESGKNKSTTTIKMPSDTKKEKDSNTDTGLAEQVLDMKLVESDTVSEVTSKSTITKVKNPNSLLNEDILKSCLGSEVHLSTSEELNTAANPNPLRPLRDALKNSISLLMESNPTITSEATTPRPKEPAVKNLKMGWCQECRHSIVKLEDTMPGIADMVPGYSTMRAESSSSTFHSIDEYREHQRQITDDQEAKKVQEINSVTPSPNEVYFCTNCFKKYYVTHKNEEIVINDPLTAVSEPLANDRGDVKPATPAPEKKPLPTPAVTVTSQPPPRKEEKPKPQPPKPPKKKSVPSVVMKPALPTPAPKDDSGLYLYIDLHGHASKKGIFMYGNHFEDMESSVECMLLPRIMSLNNIHFHFSSCNFTERNMYLKDRRDGMSREGSGRVAVLKATGLVRSYTLECNYNTGRLVNVLPPRRDDPAPAPAPPVPPKYTPHIYEEVGRALGASILDLTSQHPNSRIPCSEHRSLAAVRDWLKVHTRNSRPQMTMSRLRPKNSNPSPTRQQSFNKKGKATEDRKENTFIVKADERRTPTYQRSSEVINMNVRISKDNSRTRFTPEEQNKPKTLAPKRRNILSIRKPNASKSVVGGGVVKAKVARRAGDDTDSQRTTSKRNLSRGSKPRCCRAMASSSSSSSGPRTWEESVPLTGKRRPFPAPPPRLKKIRLKTGL